MPPQGSTSRPRARSGRARRTPVWTWWVLGGVLVVAFLAGFLWNRGQSETEQATVHRPTSTAGRNGGAIVGDANAPVTITEYGDFQCPVCAALHQAWGPTLDQLIQQGKVKFEFVGLGYLDGDGSESTRSAAAALCAADAGKFVEYYDVLYNQQSPVERSGFLTTDQLLKFGADVGITDPTFTKCVRDGRYDGWVRRTSDVASRKGVTGTPTVFVNGRQVNNAVVADPSRLTALVNQAAGQG